MHALSYIIHHPAGLFDPGAIEVAGTGGLVESRQQHTVQCIACSHDPQGQLKPTGAFQHISSGALADHQRSRRHLERLEELARGERQPPAVPVGTPPVIPSPQPRWYYRCRVCQLDQKGEVHERARCHEFNQYQLADHLTTRNHLRRASTADPRLAIFMMKQNLTAHVIQPRLAPAPVAPQPALGGN